MARKKIDEKIRQDVIKAHENGVPKRRIAQEFGISFSSVGRIVRNIAPQNSHQGITEKDRKTERQKRIEDIERRIAELERKILALEAKKEY